MKIKIAAVLASAAALLAPLSAHALVTSTKAITCSSTVKLQAAIDAVPAGAVATINVSGTCNENITVPEGKTVSIVGVTATSKITAANALLPAVTAKGDVTLKKLSIFNSTGAAESLVSTENSGTLYVISSDLRAPAVESVVGAWGGQVTVANTRVLGGIYSALDVWGATLLKVEGNPLYPVGPTGRYESYIKSAGDGIDCGQNASLRVVTKSRGTSHGMVTIEQSAMGIAGTQCSVMIVNKTPEQLRLRIRNNKTGLNLQQSSVLIEKAQVLSNTDYSGISVYQTKLILQRSSISGNQIGLFSEQSDVRIDASTFSNVQGDVSAARSSSIHFVNWGVSSLPKALTWDSSLSCWAGSRIDVDNGAVSPALGTHYDFTGCVFVE